MSDEYDNEYEDDNIV